MAPSTTGVVATKPSFAKVAAMAPPQRPSKTVDSQSRKPNAQSRPIAEAFASHPSPLANPTLGITKPHIDAENGITAITKGVAKLNVAVEASDQDARNHPNPDAAPLVATPREDGSHLSNSSSKPASFDSKSLASENTFAMEEKESLRPDDSASVQATDEEESVYIAPVSARPENLYVSEGGNTSPRKTQHDGVVSIATSAPRLPITTMINPPRFGEMIPDVPAVFPPVSSSPGIHDVKPSRAEPILRDLPISTPPDEKLIEAMGTPKDRLLLLQLEEKFVAFTAQSKHITLDLPPQNAYERLLAHKLADYYNLSRLNSMDNTSIRLYKAAGFMTPVPLRELCGSVGGKDGLPTGAVAVKIMRRTILAENKVPNDGSTAASSSGPSKTTSEAGAENTSDEGMPSPPAATPSKDRSQWTREEREAHYKAARERIFRDFEEVPNGENSTADTSAEISRSSSVTGKKRNYKQRTPRDDSFEARSSFIPGFRGMTYAPQHQVNGQHAGPVYQSPQGSRSTFAAATTPPAVHTAGFHGPYDPVAMAYPAGPFPNGYAGQYGSGEQWSTSQPPQPAAYYNLGQQPGAGYGPYGSMMPSSAQQYPQAPTPAFQYPNTPWTQNQYQPSYQTQPMMAGPMGPNNAPVAWPNYPQQVKTPGSDGGYPFGAVMYQPFAASPPPPPQMPHNPHPLPGSYNRSAFNPQTRSFVPTVSSMRYGAIPTSQAPAMSSPSASVPSGPAGANNSISSSSGGQSAPKPDPAVAIAIAITPSSSSSSPSSAAAAAEKRSQESLQKKWGTPSHLPKKPPPSQIPSSFEVENPPPPPLPSRQSFSPTCA